jgi:hypothetical protein
MIEIEKDIPLPGDYDEKKAKFPVNEMEPGESLLFPAEMGKNAPYNAQQYWQRKTNRRFIIRPVDNGWRMWRVK